MLAETIPIPALIYAEEYMKQKCLVSGSQGFLASHLIPRLFQEKYDIDTMDIKTGKDIRTHDFNSFPKAIGERHNVIFHLAAQASPVLSFENPEESHTHNVFGTLRILEYARKIRAKVVFASSSSIYGDAQVPFVETQPPNPLSPYAVQKFLCEEYMKYYWKLGVKSVALRLFNVYGERMPSTDYSVVLATFLKQYKNKEPFTIVGSGEQRRDFVFVGDVIEAMIKATEWLDKATQFEVFNIGSGINYSINEITSILDKNHPKKYLPKRDEPNTTLANIKKAEKLLGWGPHENLGLWLRGQIARLNTF